MKASSETLFNELNPEERLRMSSSLHLHPDMKTHMDRPLRVEGKNGDQPSMPAEESQEGAPQQDGVGDSIHTHSRRHHRHRDRNGEGGGSRGERHHTHHSRSREQNADGPQVKERRGERSQSRDGGQGHRHHHQAGSPEEEAGDAQGERGREERGHRHHHSHRAPKEGNGLLVNVAQGEGRGRGGGGGNGERKALHSRMARAQSTLGGDECKRASDKACR